MATRYRCPACGFVYGAVDALPRDGDPPGSSQKGIPSDGACPDCAVREKAERAVNEVNRNPSDMIF